MFAGARGHRPDERKIVDRADEAAAEGKVAARRDPELGDAAQPFLQRDTHFGPRQIGAKAEMRTLAEGNVLAAAAGEIDRPGIGIEAVVAPRQRRRQRDHVTLAQLHPVVFEIVLHFTRETDHRKPP